MSMIEDLVSKQVYNAGDFSLEMIKEVFQDLFYKRDQENKDRARNIDWTPIHYEWDDEEGHHSCWKIGIAYTNDAGYEQFSKAIEEDLKKD